jgi:hypothetical protein
LKAIIVPFHLVPVQEEVSSVMGVPSYSLCNDCILPFLCIGLNHFTAVARLMTKKNLGVGIITYPKIPPFASGLRTGNGEVLKLIIKTEPSEIVWRHK